MAKILSISIKVYLETDRNLDYRAKLTRAILFVKKEEIPQLSQFSIAIAGQILHSRFTPDIQELGAPIDQLLIEFEELPIAVASIDQQGIDLLAGVEVVISHLVVKNYGIPCAHAHALLPLSLSPFYVQNQVLKR
ncbi:uncharacterized protein Fot_22329 [Forsythia ovata]|uniref:Uncharacterized protein n=1 Tax=Forsythia ovata TaxID=205694 RepID=A0ABD1UZA4_9LAMI